MVAAVLVNYFSTDICIKRSTGLVLSGLNQDDFEHIVSRIQNNGRRKARPGYLHQRYDRLLCNAKLVQYFEKKWSSQVDESRFTNWEKIKSRSTREKKSPNHASRKKYKGPSCQSLKQTASKFNLFCQTPDIPAFNLDQISRALIWLLYRFKRFWVRF